MQFESKSIPKLEHSFIFKWRLIQIDKVCPNALKSSLSERVNGMNECYIGNRVNFKFGLLVQRQNRIGGRIVNPTPS